MVLRLLLGLGVAAAWLTGTFLGAVFAALRTDAGRRLVVSAAVAEVNARIHGSVAVGEAGGSFLEGLVLHDVRVADAAGNPVITVERAVFRYRLRDLLSGRIAFGQAILERPHADLVKPGDGRPLNLESIFASGGADSGSTGRPYIAFTDVRIVDANVVLRTPARPSDRVPEGSNGPDGYQRVRRIEGFSAQLPFLRLSSPRSHERAMLAEISALAARVTDPAIGIAEMRGQVEFWGDSITLRLPHVRLAETRGQLNGSLAWATDTLLLNLDVQADHLVTDEMRGLVADIPAALSGSGHFIVRSLSGAVTEISGRNLVLDGARGGGRAEGRLGFVLGPGAEWAARNTRLTLRNFDLEYVRGLLDTLPLAGRVGGRVTADGARNELQVDVDGTFRDSLVPDWPVSRLRGAGRIDLTHPEGAAFHSLELEDTEISLATIERLVPAVRVRGRLGLTGTLGGTWENMTFTGAIRHADPPLPASAGVGTVRLDTRSATTGVWAEIMLDSLRLAGLRSSFPALDHDATFGGRLTLAGYLDSLHVDASLGSRGGIVRGSAVLAAGDEQTRLEGLTLELQDLDVQAFAPDLPETQLFGHVSGAMRFGPAGMLVQADVRLVTSVIAGARLDSAAAAVTISDSLVTLDMLRAWAAAVRVEGRGAFGLATPQRGSVSLTLAADSIGVLEPILVQWLGPLDSAAAWPAPSGSATLALVITGATDDYEIGADLQARGLRRGAQYVSRATGTAHWTSTSGAMRLDAALDSVALGELGFGDVELQLQGRPDSLRWHGRTRFGSDGAWIGGGRLRRDSTAVVVGIDSMGVLLASGAWFLDRTATLAVRDSALDFENMTLASDRHAGRIAVAGRLPFRGPGRLSASIEALPMRDVWVLLQNPPEDVAGELNGTFEFRGRAREPEFELRAALRDGVFGTFRAPYVEGTLRYAARRLRGDVSLWRVGDQILEISGDLPVDLAVTGAAERRLPGPLTVRAVANGVDLGLLGAVTPTVRRVGGTLDADFGVTGSWDRPQLTGRLEVKDGTATFPALGVRHEALNGRLRLSGDTIRVEQLSVRSGSGSAQIAGFVRLEELTRPVLNLHITGRNFRAIEVRDFLSLTASADLELRGPVMQPVLTGRGTATRGVLYFADLFQKNIINLEDTLFAGVVDSALMRRQGLGSQFENRFLDSLRIDSLRLEMGSDVWMRSAEANIQLAGVVTVDKVRDQHRLDGTLETPRGSYRLEIGTQALVRDFNVTRGQVRYFGTPDLDADLDIEARHEVRSIRGETIAVFVHIGGTLYEPTITLTSDVRPALSDTEIISYLLFGAPSVQAFTGTRGAQNRFAAQQVLNALSGQLEYTLISDLGIPLDYLEIRPGEAVGAIGAGTEIAVGKQFRFLGTTAFLTASQRICPGRVFEDFGASLEFRLSRQWLLSMSVDPARGCETVGQQNKYQFGFDLFWEKRFE